MSLPLVAINIALTLGSVGDSFVVHPNFFLLHPPDVIALTAVVKSDTPHTLSWYHNGKFLTNNPELHVSTRVAATYQAVATNTTGIGKSGVFRTSTTTILSSANITITTKK